MTVSSRQVLRLPGHTLETSRGGLLLRMYAHLGLQLKGVLTRRECSLYARGVYAGRSAWTPNFDGVQFTLGRAWYTHLETDREDEYFENVAESDATVERFVPGLADRLLAMMSRVVGREVARRPGWCGPGVHIFPSEQYVSYHGGDVHFDLEGLSEEHLAEHAGAISAILMLQPAAQGGGLRIWDTWWENEDTEEAPSSTSSDIVTYDAGDLVIIDSYRLHQIQESSGPLDRISATAHAVREGDRWLAWF